MQTYDNGEWGTRPSKLDDAKNSNELITIMNSIGFCSLTEMNCRTGTGHLSMRERRTQKGVDTIYPYCFLLPISGFFQPIMIKDTKSLIRFLAEIDARKKSVDPIRVEGTQEIKRVLQQIATALNNIETENSFLQPMLTTQKTSNGEVLQLDDCPVLHSQE